MQSIRVRGLAFLFATLGCVHQLLGDTVIWVGGFGNWNDPNKWTNTSGIAMVPGDGDTAMILTAGSSVRVDTATAELSLFRMTTGILVFSNWNTRLSAADIRIEGGTVTLPNAFTWLEPSNRIWLAAGTNFFLASNATLNANFKGYATTNGPGGGISQSGGGSGAGHGGWGGRNAPNNRGGSPYNDPTAPIAPGSGGGHTSYGGAGGGAVFIDASNAVVSIHGTITANGQSGTTTHGGGGSGGSIYILCKRFQGSTNGLLRVRGGNGVAGGGGGAGGRIAVVYDPAEQATIPNPGVRMDGYPGRTETIRVRIGESGTGYYPDTRFITPTLDGGLFYDVRLIIPNFTNWSVHDLIVSNCLVHFVHSNFVLIVSNNAQFYNGGIGLQGNAEFHVAGSFVMTNKGFLQLSAGPTNGIAPYYGALLSVTGDMRLENNSWVYSISDGTNGGSPVFRMANLFISTNSGFDASEWGFQPTYGPGAGATYSTSGGGAGYGGFGGCFAGGAQQGPVYGDPAFPEYCGSGAGNATLSGAGGGLIRIEAPNGTVTLHGSLLANGQGSLYTHGGGGSGGGILVICSNIAGSSTGLIRARGAAGNLNGGGGGGGRIAILYNPTAQGGLWPGIRLDVRRGDDPAPGRGYGRSSEDGTVWLPDTAILSPTMIEGRLQNTRLLIGNVDSWSPSSLFVSNCSFVLEQTNFALSVGGPMTILNGSVGLKGDFRITVSEDLILSNSASLNLYGGPTNGLSTDYSGLVQIGGSAVVSSGCWVNIFSDWQEAGTPFFRAHYLRIAPNAGFNASGTGFRSGLGYGAGTSNGGGGYGGKGGGGNATSYNGGPTYGSRYTPLHAGSGGQNASLGAPGGGLIRIETSGPFLLGGSLLANGDSGYSVHGGGGSGGGIFVRCATFQGTPSAVLSAKGGNRNGTYNGGGGGGGRIAVWIGVSQNQMDAYIADGSGRVMETNAPPGWEGTLSVTNGSGFYDPPSTRAAEPGTASFFVSTAVPGTLMILR